MSVYIKTLRNMAPEKRLLKAFELSAFTNRLFIHGLKKRHPDMPAAELSRMLKDRLNKCHNRNY